MRRHDVHARQLGSALARQLDAEMSSQIAVTLEGNSNWYARQYNVYRMV